MDSPELIECLVKMIEIKQPVFIEGKPGMAKSAVVRQATDLSALREGKPKDFIDMRALLYNLADLMGVPTPDQSGQFTKWLQPAFLPRSGAGVILIDELSAAPPLIQAAFYQLILDRRIGDYVLPPDWAILAAGNRLQDAAVAHRMSTALANRFVWVELDVTVSSWVAWGLPNGIRTEILAFVRLRPDLLHCFDPKSSDEKAFPSLRTWEFLSRIMDSNPGPEIFPEIAAGTIGVGPSIEFLGFLDLMGKLPSPDSIILNPQTAAVPTDDPAAMFAICGGLAALATDQTFPGIVAYADRLPAEFSVLLVKDCIGKQPDLTTTRSYIDWATANKGVLL